MDPKLIEKYMAAMEKNGIKKMVVKSEGIEIELEREAPFYAMGTVSLPHTLPPPPSFVQPVISEATVPSSPLPEIEKREEKYITSPMIGTFYISSSPGAPPLVKSGDVLTEDSIVCIIEAMKVMNEIKAGIKGTVVEILVKNGEPVDFGTKLFRIV